MSIINKKCGCGKNSIYYKSYEGRAYCKRCLARQIEMNVKKTLRKDGLIKKGDKIAVAVSGGKDSCFLLYIINKIFRNVKGIDFFALCIDEGIKGYRKKSLDAAKKLCKMLDVKYYVVKFDDAFNYTIDKIMKRLSDEKSRQKICTYCGVFKRYLINKEARKLNATKVAVGHNLNDEAESVLMNILRGDFNRFLRLGASPILIEDKKFVQRIKPIRNVSADEIILYNKINKIPFYYQRCPYSYDNVRRDVKNIIDRLEKKYPGTKYQIVRFYDKLKPILLKRVKPKGKVKYCKICKEPTSRDICEACELLEKLKN